MQASTRLHFASKSVDPLVLSKWSFENFEGSHFSYISLMSMFVLCFMVDSSPGDIVPVGTDSGECAKENSTVRKLF